MSEADLSKYHILLVDDEESVRDSIERLLTDEGFKVTTAANGLHGAQKLNTPTKFNLLITDMKMAGLDGVELIKKMKNLGAETPVLVITGFADKEKVLKIASTGTRQILTKPVKADAILDKVYSLLGIPRSEH